PLCSVPLRVGELQVFEAAMKTHVRKELPEQRFRHRARAKPELRRRKLELSRRDAAIETHVVPEHSRLGRDDVGEVLADFIQCASEPARRLVVHLVGAENDLEPLIADIVLYRELRQRILSGPECFEVERNEVHLSGTILTRPSDAKSPSRPLAPSRCKLGEFLQEFVELNLHELLR